MSESTPIPRSWVSYCNKSANEVWVPSHFHLDAFINAGVDEKKLQVIPEATDVFLWDPRITVPLNISQKRNSDFNFFSVFKWESRKGWDILLSAYFEEFSATEKVTLFIQTYLYGDREPRNEKKILAKIESFAQEKGYINKTDKEGLNKLPRIVVLSKELNEVDMPKLYMNFDCFVLPTRGEGWGLPIMEAMAMEMPVIATNWSGPSEFLTEKNSYPVSIEGTEPMESSDISISKGEETPHWAIPSLSDVKQNMRKVFNNREEAAMKGKLARQDVVSKYSQEKVAQKVMSRLQEIEQLLYK